MPRGRWCEAVRLIQDHDLSDLHLHLLLSIVAAPKSRRTGVFHLDYLRRKRSVMAPFNQSGLGLARAMQDLANRGLLNRTGPKRFSSTADGDLVRHSLDDIKNQLWLLRRDAQFVVGLELIGILKQELCKRCRNDRALQRGLKDLR